MRIKFQKTMNIVSELLAYCHNHHYGTAEYHLDITQKSDSVTLVLKASPESITTEQLDFLRTALSAPRQRETEQQFWELIGETETASELTLIGMLCDEAYVEYVDNILTIKLTRHD